ncbi:serine hydroxymethyltransferase [Streptomyces sp. NPDC050619]|uniref:serine hydroxymethyltransferase n=1 Tax=Streptomyces sp. NPDC050619 TaxID=3157214 RepID=UPI00343681AB
MSEIDTVTQHPSPENADIGEHAAVMAEGSRLLRHQDPELAQLLDQEVVHQESTLAMVAHASLAHPSVLSAAGSVLGNLTVEGYPRSRYHPGSTVFDGVEELAVHRAKEAFGARYANVQPHSCSSANLSVLFGLLLPGDTLLGMDLDAGGHLTHGASASVTGRYFRVVRYGLDSQGLIDYDQVARLARRHRPKLIVAGASAYPRTIDYARFRAVADEVGAYLLADISHIAGLVAAGTHPSPIDIAHITTTSTYKQLGGPRGGLILIGREWDTPSPDGGTTLARLMQRAVFPRSQGTPNPSAIAAKARALALVAQPAFKELAARIVANARSLSARLVDLGHQVLTGGTDNHMLLLGLSDRQLTGLVAEQALESCGILANRNRIPGDTKPPLVAGGLRLGTNIVSQRGMGAAEMKVCAELVALVLDNVAVLSDTEYELDAAVGTTVRDTVRQLCRQYPVDHYRSLSSPRG